MDSQSPMEANNQIVVAEVVSEAHEQQESLSIEQGQSSEGDAPPVAAAEEEEEMENNNYQLMMMPEQEREYGCRYCRKKFSNKQALGGHQNAHKVERAMEKNEEEAGGICFNSGRYAPYRPRMSAAAAAATAAFLSNLRHHPEFQHHHHHLHRPLWNLIHRQMVGGGSNRNSRPLPHGYNLYHQQLQQQQPWPAAAAPRVPAYAVNPHYALPVHIRLANFGAGSSSSNAFVSGSDQGFVQPRPVNLRNVPDVNHVEPGLDLSLKLGCGEDVV